MKNLISHINFLITKHNCVIVPDFGGFVVNRTAASINEDGIVVAPKISFAFNQDLKYNDGLLAESYMNDTGVSYEEACETITEVVKRLNTALAVKKTVNFGRIGELSINETNGALIFTPNKNVFFHPLIFGYSNLLIEPLAKITEIKEKIEEKKKRFEIKRYLGGAVAAAAAIFFFFVASTPITENNSTEIQKSGFLTNITKTVPASSPGVLPQEALNEDGVDISKLPTTATLDEIKTPASVETGAKQAAEPTPTAIKKPFYIIVAGEIGKNAVERRLSQIKNDGLASARTLESPSRTRIYVASFASRAEAETYLVQFKSKYPKYDDAWVYAKNR
ncbi:MAG: hypothetical protein ACK5MK_09475 [Dysgonomonas sp.]